MQDITSENEQPAIISVHVAYLHTNSILASMGYKTNQSFFYTFVFHIIIIQTCVML